MGLDMYAYAVEQGTKFDDETSEEIWYWCKNNALHGWMQELYESKGGSEVFNCVPLQLEAADLTLLRSQIELNQLKPVEGFFFGEQNYSESQKLNDLQFVESALELISNGFDIYYNCWW